ncbi:MAG: hypothetical protein COY58_05690 [Gammaproteobacteria bacterium CG_4_10_14_0_8_um_filter_38_16]|nr:MAG: hypothetical protein COY58_05690 [Gammaproteobacteria bacterium CG_4_10_14_0_8_um_filter_38_16]PJA04383.1 MAG: hypothetical protein COX72_00300 [Gammaproteobacteria bacterium CG_4_10_14_0_2_um_filter_38_22]PJB10196.1 MAG: hypothetical protein CO120_06280 [Gammaproteobacteria bacterium CG_4_9_14_3_um_filter_38_9]
MRQFTFNIISIILLCITITASAFATSKHYLPLTYQLNGIDNPNAQKNAATALDNLKNQLAFPLTPAERRHFYDKAPQVIKRAITPFGYFKSNVQESMQQTKRTWMATFNVTPGPLLPITRIQIQIQGAGKNDSKFQHQIAYPPFKVGEPLITKKYDSLKTDLFDLATDRGYFQAKMVKSQIRIDLAKYQAAIVIIFNTGPRYHFGKTTFSKSPFHESFLRRFLSYKQGEYYHAKKLENTKEGYVSSNLFDQVIIKADTKHAKNDVVPIRIDFIPRKAKEYTLGLGYGTDTGVRGTVGVTLRRIGGNGHRFHTLLRASPDNSGFTAQYLIPGIDPAHDLLTFGAGVSNMSQSTGSARNAKLAVGYTLSHGHWRTSLSLAYLNERYNLVNLPKTSTELVYPTLGFKYLNTDHHRNPHQGISLNTQFAVGSKQVLSQTDFFQVRTNLNTLYTIEKTHTRLLFRTELGHTNINNLTQLPLSLQLFAGGSHSVRGYSYNSIGPGRNLVVASTEVQQRLFGDFYLAAFSDAGTVGNKNIFHQIHVGVGPGLAWISTIGTIELTIGQAITQPNKPWSIQFTMGSVL